ncbi:hypothetical protein D3C76_1179370 [compost metagenome]
MRHFPGHRGDDTGVIKVGFGAVQRGLVAFDLRIDGANLRLLDRQLRNRGIQILLRDRLGRSQLPLTVQGHLGQLTLRFSLAALGAQLHQGRLHLFDLVFGLLRIDDPQQLPFFHFVANLHRQRFQLPADLRAYVHLAQRVQLAGGEHALLQLARTDNQRLIVRHRGVKHPPQPESSHQYNQHQQQKQLPAFSLKVHKYSK